MDKKAICLISGGLDSCVSSFIAKEKGYQIYALSFNYGQSHTKELKCAKKIARDLEAKDHLIFSLDLSRFGKSALFNKSQKKIQFKEIDNIGKNIPSTYVPARNTVFLSIGLAYAETINANAIFVGINALDYAGYPDCRYEYLKAFQKMSNLATKCGVEGKTIIIEAPLINMLKSDIIKTGEEINACIEKTWSCYRGNEKACGRCDSCLLRLKGFKESGFLDPIEYESLPNWY